MKKQRWFFQLGPFRIVLIYAVVSFLWIYFSDTLLGSLVHDPQIITVISLFKGFIFVFITAILLYFFIRRDVLINLRRNDLLRSRERWFDQLLENSFDNIVILDADGIQRYVSKSVIHTLGFQPEQLLNISVIEEMIHPDDQKKVKDTFLDIITKGEGGGIQYRHRHKNGGWVYLEAWGTNQLDNPDIKGVVINCRIITDQKLAEAALMRESSFRNAIIENLPGMVWFKDKEGRFLAINRKFAHGCGHDNVLDVIGKTDFDIWPKELAEKYRADDNEVMRTGKPFRGEELIEDQGFRRLYETFKTPVMDSSGEILGTSGFAQDITERKMAGEEHKAILQTAMEGFYLVDIDGRIIDVNGAYCSMIGYCREELLKMGVKDVDALESEEAVQKRIRLILETGPVRFETKHRCKDGRIIDIEASCNFIESAKDKIFVFMHDITQRKQAQEDLRLAKEKAEAANRYKTEFLMNISHDLRTPLHAILGFSDTLNSMELEEKYRKGVYYINQRARHLMTMVEEILSVSKIESGRIELKYEKLDLYKLLESSIEAARIELGPKNVILSLEVKGTIPALKGDALRVQQIIDNLLSNAVKYTPQGQIKVTVAPYPEPSQSDQYRVRVSVKDTGIGIPADKLPFIFESFTRFHEFYEGKAYDGVGLGLYFVKKIVSLLGGDILALSEIGRGSEFILTLKFDKA
ncbi:MAG: PAS domain S-box protein [Candidatus Omnitrophica bacterium]|nr:PAS domain S-box protein [Candidatus Omnitrophota bacterium]